MRLSDIITADSIHVGYTPADSSKAAVIRDLVGLLSGARGLDGEQRQAVEEAVLAREQQKPTGIGRGVAVPHGKNERVAGVLGLLAICAEGESVDFGAPDSDGARFIVLMVSDFNTTAAHVAALAQITRLLQKAEFVDSLADADAADVHARLREHESELAV
jgi:mannitol/fructose-specific phosphotransferase system IIA component (Ntr-type)